jgi:two-component system, NtrC family, nitrogen regulation sensor histidine kinase NtrY
MHAISRRSEGLLDFVEAYRNLTLLPRPSLRITGIQALVHRVDLLFRPQCADAGIVLTTTVDPRSLEFNADPGQMEQVLINLLQNALAAVRGRDDRRIGLSASLDNRGQIVIEVTDNGCGIPAEVQEKIFVPFFTTKEKGSGIGLSLSRQIVHMHGGTLTCRSKQGEGATFTIRI